MGQLQTILDHYRNGLVERQLTLRSYANVGVASNFTSYGLLNMGVLPSELTSGGVWYLQSWDKTSDSNKGQMEDMQLQITAHTLPNRADTDGDGLNDSEEVNLGADGFATDPWKLDTDGDGLADHEYATKGTSPLLADTDRDGDGDAGDKYPLDDIFARVTILDVATPSTRREPDTTAEEGDNFHDAYLEPFASFTYDGETIYSPYLNNAADGGSWLGATYYVNVPDDSSVPLSFSVALWDFDFDRTNPDPVDISTASGMQNSMSFVHTLQAVGVTTTYTFIGSSSGLSSTQLYASSFRVEVAAVAPTRAPAYLLVPLDYSGIYNVTDGSGATTSLRYVGEPRFVALTIQAQTSRGPGDVSLYLVPRSIFVDTEFEDLLERQALSPNFGLTFSQNGTTSANSDALQTILSTRLMPDGIAALEDLFLRNTTGNVSFQWIRVDAYLPVLGLPDDAIRLAGYRPLSHGLTRNYTWGIDESAPVTTPWSIWDMIWNGIVSVIDVVLTFIESAIVFVVTIVDAIVQAIVQFGSWLSQGVAQAAQVVASAVEAAAKVLEQFVDWIVDSVVALVNSFLNALVAPLIGSFENLLDATTLMALTVQAPGKGSVTSVEFIAAFQGFVLALADLLLLISTFQLLLLAVDIGLTALSLTGFGSLVMVAAEVAVIIAFALIASQLVGAIEGIFLDVVAPALAFSALVLAIIGTFVAVISALTPQWTETTYNVVRNDFRGVYGELVDQVNIRPVITQETRRVYSQTAGSGMAVLLSIVALAFVSLQLVIMTSVADPLTKAIAVLIFDTIAIVLAVKAVIDAAKLPAITSLSRWSKALAPLSLGVSSAAFAIDLANYQRVKSQGS